MVEIKKKEHCCGCSACAEICPKHCIEMKEDSEGFLYPYVDVDRCINCGQCNKACPELNVGKKTIPMKVWAAYTTDEEIRKNSSSGGVFYTVASDIIQKGGVVFGARYNEQWGVEFGMADTIEGLTPLMVSKYVQGNVGTAYIECKKLLKEGRLVFFTGTSCQIAGLKCFLGKEYEHLITAEVVCHGVPSPCVWQLYLDEISGESFNSNCPRTKIKTLSFRRKERSWDRFNMYIEFFDKSKAPINVYHMDNVYMRAFVNNLILRPSCYECKFKNGKAHADLTIADYWGVVKFHPNMYDDKGTSLIIAGTKKGVEMINQLPLFKVVSSFRKAVYCNPAIIKSHHKHKNRAYFFSHYKSFNSLSEGLESCLRSNALDNITKTLKQCVDIVEKRIRFYLCR